MLLELVKPMADGITLEPNSLEARDGIAHVRLTNPTRFIQHLDDRVELGEVMGAAVISTKSEETEPVTDETETSPYVKRIGTKDVEWRRQKVYELFSNKVELPEEENRRFCDLLT